MRAVLSVVTVALLITAVLAHDAGTERRLLRADAGLLPTDAVLMEFARTRGVALFESKCALCHEASGLGSRTRGIPDLTDADWLYGSGKIGDIEQIIRFGIRSRQPRAWNLARMPAYARPVDATRRDKIAALSPREIRDSVEFLIAAQGRPVDAEAAARGAGIYAGAGGCYDCHAADAKGDSAIGAPDLTDGVTLYGDGSREALAASIAYGRQGLCPGSSGRVSAAGIREIAVYVYSLSQPPRAGR